MHTPEWLNAPDELRILAEAQTRLKEHGRLDGVAPIRLSAYAYYMARALRWERVPFERIHWVGYIRPWSTVDGCPEWIETGRKNRVNGACLIYRRAAEYAANGILLLPERSISWYELLSLDKWDEFDKNGRLVKRWGGYATCRLQPDWGITRW